MMGYVSKKSKARSKRMQRPESGTQRLANSKKKPELGEFILNRDYQGALALLEFNSRSDAGDKLTNWWIGYCAFHLGQFQRAIRAYDDQIEINNRGESYVSEAKVAEPTDESEESKMEKKPVDLSNQALELYKACCYYYLGDYEKTQECAKKASGDTKGSSSESKKDSSELNPVTESLKTRLLFHLSHKLGHEDDLLEQHQKLGEEKEDQLSLAAIHYLRTHFQEATDIYKRSLLQYREDFALNVYVAMCYYKLDYYDVSLEILNIYINHYPSSIVAINLRACNHFKLYNGKAAEVEVKTLLEHGVNYEDNDLIKHNLVVFRGGENALQVLPPLVDAIPEARLNLVIYYLRNDEISEAEHLIEDLDPSTPQEYILKAVVNACIGQAHQSREHSKMAQTFFQLVGASAAECDTIPGRQCMASCFFLLKQFEDVNIYLNSIKAYLYNDDDFNWNYGISLASTGKYKEAEEALLLVQSEKYRNDPIYLMWLCRCYIMNKKASDAWSVYIKLESPTSPNLAFNLAQLIANDCYKTGDFFYSAKAFDILDQLDTDMEHFEAKRGACIGVFQSVIAGESPKEYLVEVMKLLRSSSSSNPQVEYLLRMINKWAKENGVLFD